LRKRHNDYEDTSPRRAAVSESSITRSM
jgi:hypothetical protein